MPMEQDPEGNETMEETNTNDPILTADEVDDGCGKNPVSAGGATADEIDDGCGGNPPAGGSGTTASVDDGCGKTPGQP